MQDVTKLISIISSIDNKRYCELSKKEKENIKYMFYDVQDNDLINAYLNEDEKGNLYIVIYIKEKKINLLVKENSYLYEENYYDFFSFLSKNNISSSSLRIFSYYHFCLVTKIDQRIKLDKKELLKEYRSYISSVNEELNKEENLKRIIAHFFHDEIGGTYIYFSHVNKIFCFEDLFSFILEGRKNENIIHFGSLEYKPNLLRLNKAFYDYSKIKIDLK